MRKSDDSDPIPALPLPGQEYSASLLEYGKKQSKGGPESGPESSPFVTFVNVCRPKNHHLCHLCLLPLAWVGSSAQCTTPPTLGVHYPARYHPALYHSGYTTDTGRTCPYPAAAGRVQTAALTHPVAERRVSVTGVTAGQKVTKVVASFVPALGKRAWRSRTSLGVQESPRAGGTKNDHFCHFCYFVTNSCANPI